MIYGQIHLNFIYVTTYATYIKAVPRVCIHQPSHTHERTSGELRDEVHERAADVLRQRVGQLRREL